MTNAQEWLNGKYTDKNIKEINSERQPLEEELELKDFLDLEKINLSNGKGITKLTIQNCPKVKNINVNYNQITELLGVGELVDLEELRIGQNEIKNINTDKNTKLTTFICFDNPFQDNKVNINNGVRFFNGDGAKYSISLSTEGSDKQKLSATAEKLNIEKDSLEGKTAKEIEELINKKIEDLLNSEKENKENKEKLEKITEKLPDLIKDGKVDEEKLNEIKDQSDKVKELEKLGIKSVEEAKKLQENNKKMSEMIGESLGPKYIAQIGSAKLGE